MAASRVPELDLLRFAAAFSVVSYHNTYRLPVHGVPSEDIIPAVQAVSRFGYIGVSLFFLISGFVILWSAEGKSARGFLASRALRLYPSFWAALALTVAAVAILAPATQVSMVDLLKNTTMLPGYLGAEFVDGVYWTLAVEIKFYFVVLLLILLRQMQRIEVWLWIWSAGLAVCSADVRVPGLVSLTLFPFGALFAGGCWAYLLYSRGRSPGRMVGFLVSLVLALFAARSEARDFIHGASAHQIIVAQMVVVACYLLILAIALRWWRTRWGAQAVFLGALTYPLYLTHNKIGKLAYAATEDHLPLLPRILLMTAIAFVLAWCMTELVEKKLVKPLGRSTIYRRLAGSQVS